MFFCDINIPASHGYICRKHYFKDGYTSRHHWHGFIEIEFFIDGTGTHKYGDSTFQIKNGDAWILSTDDSHQLNLDKGMKSVNIAVDPDILHERLLKHLSMSHPLHCTFNEEEIQDFLSKVDSLCQEQENRKLLSRVKAMSTINDMMVDIARKASNDTLLVNNSLVNDMLNYLQSNYKSNISLQELAKIFSYSPNYCGHIFKEITGITFNDYVNNLRAKNACKLLLNTNLSIEAIAYDSGFNSVEYFYSTFKKFYGITPAKYRTLTPKDFSTPSLIKNRPV